jgi:hypothetical protein
VNEPFLVEIPLELLRKFFEVPFVTVVLTALPYFDRAGFLLIETQIRVIRLFSITIPNFSLNVPVSH